MWHASRPENPNDGFPRQLRAMSWRESDQHRRRLGRGIRGCTTRRWDGPLQGHCNANGFQDTHWQTGAQNKNELQAFEHTFAQACVGIQTHARVPTARWMIGETP